MGTHRALDQFGNVGAGTRAAGLTEVDVGTARRYAEASREALARYDRKGNVGCWKEAAN